MSELRVKLGNFRGARNVPLEDYLTPTTGGYDSGGALEQAQDLARKSAEGLGKLLAILVEKRVITFDEAESCAGAWDGELLP